MTMNLKKVFTSTSFNLSSVFYARFCAGSFYQEFDECRTFLLYKKKKPLTRYLLTHQQLLSCFVSVYFGDREIQELCWDNESTVETVCLLGKRKPDTKVKIGIDMDDYYRIRENAESK